MANPRRQFHTLIQQLPKEHQPKALELLDHVLFKGEAPEGITGKDGAQGSKGKDGAPGKKGKPGISYWLSADAACIITSSTTSASWNPSTITMTAYSKAGDGAPVAYSGRFTVETWVSSSWTTRYTSSSDESTHTWTCLTGLPTFSKVRITLYLAGGTNTKLDEVVIPAQFIGGGPG